MSEGVRAVGGGGQGILLTNLIFKLELDLLQESGGYLDCVEEIIVQPEGPSVINVVIVPADILLHLLIPNPEQQPWRCRRPLRDQLIKAGKVPGPALERAVAPISRFPHEPEPGDEILRDFEVAPYAVAHTALLLDIKLGAPIARNAESQSPVRVESEAADKVLGIIRVIDVDPGAVENAQRIVEFIPPKASPGLDSNIPFLNKLRVAKFRIIKPSIPGELEVKIGTAGKRQEAPWGLRFDAEGDPLLPHPNHHFRFGQHDVGKSITQDSRWGIVPRWDVFRDGIPEAASQIIARFDDHLSEQEARKDVPGGFKFGGRHLELAFGGS